LDRRKDLGNWTFETEEVSAGVYRVRGTDHEGRSVERTEDDPRAAMEAAQEAAKALAEPEA
jgi:hypothetical protein